MLSAQNTFWAEALIIYFCRRLKMVAIAQLVRASDCGSEGRGFEPHWLPQKTKTSATRRFFYFHTIHHSSKSSVKRV